VTGKIAAGAGFKPARIREVGELRGEPKFKKVLLGFSL